MTLITVKINILISSCAIFIMSPFVRNLPVTTSPSSSSSSSSSRKRRRSRARASPRASAAARNGVERAKIITEQFNRKSVGSASRHPVPAGINFVCDVCQVVLDKMPDNHAHWHHACTGALHVVSDVLTASSN